MSSRFVKFLYAIDFYLLYLLSGAVAAAGVVAFYSVRMLAEYGGHADIDGMSFVEQVGNCVSGKSSVTLLVSYALVLLVLTVVFAIRKKSLAAYSGLSHARAVSCIGAAILGIALNVITFSIVEGEGAAPAADGFGAVAALCVLTGPFIEELVFRGVLLKMLRSSVGVLGAVLITSVLFAAAHGDWVQMLYTLALGLVLALVRIQSGGLWSPILLHLAYNVTGLLLPLCRPELGSFAVVSLGVCAFIAFLLSCRSGRA